MVRIQQLKLPISHTSQELEGKISKILRIPISDILSYEIVKQSIDARKKNEVSFVYTIDVVMAQEEMRLKQIKNPLVSQAKRISYKVVGSGTQTLSHAPVIIGSGPAGMFCGYLLAEQGYAPILIERGKKVEERQQDVALFWKEMVLNSESNVQFGEGGAGTFSDGKLNTL
ncbi:MAG: FAD-dependent oxidoreductase, partial [Lachnospiraceae bacterium]